MRCPYCWRKLQRQGQRQLVTVLLTDQTLYDDVPYVDAYGCICQRSNMQLWDELGDVHVFEVSWPEVRNYLPAVFSWSWHHKIWKQRWFALRSYWYQLLCLIPAYRRRWNRKLGLIVHE